MTDTSDNWFEEVFTSAEIVELESMAEYAEASENRSTANHLSLTFYFTRDQGHDFMESVSNMGHDIRSAIRLREFLRYLAYRMTYLLDKDDDD